MWARSTADLSHSGEQGDLGAAADLSPPSPDLAPVVSFCGSRPDLLWCDSFDTADWKGGIGQNSVDSTHVYRTTGSLDSHLNVGRGISAILAQPSFSSPDFYVRVFVLR
jgi:hypothetical protein